MISDVKKFYNWQKINTGTGMYYGNIVLQGDGAFGGVELYARAGHGKFLRNG